MPKVITKKKIVTYANVYLQKWESAKLVTFVTRSKFTNCNVSVGTIAMFYLVFWRDIYPSQNTANTRPKHSQSTSEYGQAIDN